MTSPIDLALAAVHSTSKSFASVGLLLFAGLAVWGLCALAGRHGFRRALSATVSTPALLVPAAMMLVGCWLLAIGDPRGLHENPFGLRHGSNLGLGRPEHWVVFTLAALTLAGHVGLLQAWQRGRKVDGYAFFGGMVDHGVALALGKLVLFGSTYAISMLYPSRLGNALYIVPSLLLAPLYAATAANPRRPIAALLAALRTSYRRFDLVGNLVFGQVMFLVASLWFADRLVPGSLGDWDLLAFSSGSLSYNVFPFALLLHDRLSVCVLLTVANALAASVFVAGYFLRLTENAAEDAGEKAEETT